MKRTLWGITLILLYGVAVYVLPVVIHYFIDRGISSLGNHPLHLFVSITSLVIQMAIVFYIS